MSNVIPLRPHAPRPAVDDTIRADCERLMRLLADLLDHIIVRVET
jgi:hypothetical protein